MNCGMCGDTGLQNAEPCPQPGCQRGLLARRWIAFSNDLWKILRDAEIPSHEHWSEPNNCCNLRDLIAAFARKHFGDLKVPERELLTPAP